jgi:hypothetical protein
VYYLYAESIEWFIEDKAFSRSYDLAPPHPPLFSFLSVSSTGNIHTGRLRMRDSLLTVEGGGRGMWEELTTARKLDHL